MLSRRSKLQRAYGATLLSPVSVCVRMSHVNSRLGSSTSTPGARTAQGSMRGSCCGLAVLRSQVQGAAHIMMRLSGPECKAHVVLGRSRYAPSSRRTEGAPPPPAESSSQCVVCDLRRTNWRLVWPGQWCCESLASIFSVGSPVLRLNRGILRRAFSPRVVLGRVALGLSKKRSLLLPWKLMSGCLCSGGFSSTHFGGVLGFLTRALDLWCPPDALAAWPPSS